MSEKKNKKLRILALLCLAIIVISSFRLTVGFGAGDSSVDHLEEGKSAFENKDYQLAIELLESCLGKGYDIDDVTLSEVHLLLAEAYQYVGRYSDAVVSAQTALEAGIKDRDAAYSIIGRSYIANGNKEKAEDLIMKLYLLGKDSLIEEIEAGPKKERE